MEKEGWEPRGIYVQLAFSDIYFFFHAQGYSCVYLFVIKLKLFDEST